MRSTPLGLVVLLAACQNSASDEMWIGQAQRSADMPSCASLRLLDTSQGRSPEGYRVTAEFAASGQCLDLWRERLEGGRWKMDHHGWWFSPGFEVTISIRDNYGVVTWYQNHRHPDVRDISAEIDTYKRKGVAS